MRQPHLNQQPEENNLSHQPVILQVPALKESKRMSQFCNSQIKDLEESKSSSAESYLHDQIQEILVKEK